MIQPSLIQATKPGVDLFGFRDQYFGQGYVGNCQVAKVVVLRAAYLSHLQPRPLLEETSCLGPNQ